MSFTRGHRLFGEGEPSKRVFFLSRGRMKLSVTSREGKTAIVRIAEAGDVLGLSAALNGATHEVTAEAIEPCLVKAISTREFLSFLEKYPAAAMEGTRCILREYQNALNDVCRLALSSTIAGRLANLLLEWPTTRVPAGQSQPRLTMTLTHEEIADMVATSRESVTRAFNQFERQRLISIKGCSLTLLQPEALEQLAMS